MKTIIVAALLVTTPAFANNKVLEVNFRESAPKDSFTLTNRGDCPISETVVLDLSTSQGNLIFDTTASGAGVEVFQPFEIVKGETNLRDLPSISDGDQIATLTLSDLQSDQSIVFTIDLDDQLKNSSLGQIRVANSEIVGATVAKYEGGSAVFGTGASVTLPLGSCDS